MCKLHQDSFEYYDTKRGRRGTWDEYPRDHDFHSMERNVCGKCAWEASPWKQAVRQYSGVGDGDLPAPIAQAIKTGSISKAEFERMSMEDRALWEMISVHFRE